MRRKIATTLVALSIAAGIGTGTLVERLDNDHPGATTPPASSGTTAATATATTTATPSSPQSTDTSDVPAGVARNRDERTGPAWSHAGPTGPDGQPLEIGNISPGAIDPLRVGDPVDKYVRAGYLVSDLQRESSCEGEYWKWAGQLSAGLDVVTDQQGRVASLGMTRSGLETAEGISIGNSYGALKASYGRDLTEVRANDYGQAGVFVPGNGDGWVGFGFEETPEKLTDSSRVVFIEVTKGSKPGLARDGC